jgi:hypothetical protein
MWYNNYPFSIIDASNAANMLQLLPAGNNDHNDIVTHSAEDTTTE